MKHTLEAAFARAAGRCPGGLLLRVIGAGPTVVDGHTLDPHVQFLLRMQQLAGRPGFCEPTPAAGRRRYRQEAAALVPTPTVVGDVREFAIPGGAQSIRVRHYAPPDVSETAAPLLVYFHGGGFVIGDLDTHDEPCRLLSRHAQTHVLSVDYRLAPEHPFPAAVEDSMAAVEWALAHAASLGADPLRVCVGGDSAGANLATVAARTVAPRAPGVCAQLLIYPVTNNADTASRQTFARGYLLEQRDITAFDGYYVPGTVPTDRVGQVHPLRAHSLEMLPPTLLVTAGFDPLRDEGQAYGAALRAAGVTVRERCEGHLVHGFLHMTTAVPAALRAVKESAHEWRTLVTPA